MKKRGLTPYLHGFQNKASQAFADRIENNGVAVAGSDPAERSILTAKRLIYGRKSLIIVLVLVLLLGLAAVGVTSGCSSGTQKLSKDLQDKLSKVVDAQMVKYGVPGAMFGIWIPGKGEWVVTKGKADLKTGAAPQVSDHVRIASITKTFTSTVILQLVDEGKVKLEDTLNKYDLGVTVPNSDKITVRNLLNMTSGLFNYTNDTENFWQPFLSDRTKPWTPKQVVDIAIAHGAVAPTGGAYDYNNTNFVLLGMIIEKVTGSTAQKEITTRIIDKLGLKNTSFPMDPAMPSPYMHGYMADPNLNDPGAAATQDTSIETPTPFFTAGAMISNMADMKTWVHALATGELLSPAMHTEQLTFGPPNTASYGLGVMGGAKIVGHSGEIPGYNSCVYTMTGGNGATFIVFLNRYPSKIEGASDQFLIELVKAVDSASK